MGIKSRSLLQVGLVLILLLADCAPLIKIDSQSFIDHPQEYEGKQVIITAELRQIIEAPLLFKGKKVELKGYVEYKGFWGHQRWHFILKDGEGRTLLCYEKGYRTTAWIVPAAVVEKAARTHQQITVVGKLEEDLEIELDWIEYKGLQIDTDYLPHRMPHNILTL